MQLPYQASDHEQAGARDEALVVIDDEPFTQECLVEAIKSAFPRTPVVGISEVAELHQVDRVALVLLRAHAQSLSGRHLASETRAIVRRCPNAPVVLLAMCTNAAAFKEAIAAGARGVIPVTTSFRVAVAALQLVMVGGTYYPFLIDGELKNAGPSNGIGEPHPDGPEPLVLSHAAARPYLTVVEQTGDALQADGKSPGVTFTARELQVLEALQKGWSNKWIAHSLRISENTIKVHVQRIMRKLHATNRTEAVVRHRQLIGMG